MIFDELSNAVFSFSLRRIGAEIMWIKTKSLPQHAVGSPDIEISISLNPDAQGVPNYFYKFSSNLLNGLICEARTSAKQG